MSVIDRTHGPKNTRTVRVVLMILLLCSTLGTILKGRLNALPSNRSRHIICCKSQLGTCDSLQDKKKMMMKKVCGVSKMTSHRKC